MMIEAVLKQGQFDAIRAHIEDGQTELLISDFNGVLDDYYVQKYAFLSRILGSKHQQLLAALAVFTDTEYISNRSATLEQSIATFFKDYAIAMDESNRHLLDTGMQSSRLTGDAEAFLGQLTIPYVIYTSQTAAKLEGSLNGLRADIYSRDRTGREKPSVHNLEMILSDYNVHPERACMLGDGLIDDLMPARLMGMKTILVSPFADSLHSIN